jgi:ketosteroid isomerase-like protein
MTVRVRCVLALVLLISPLAFANEAADRAAIETAAQAWIKAFNAHDADALAGLATPDVMLMDPAASAPVVGVDSLRDASRQTSALAKTRITSTTKEISISHDIAWRIGTLNTGQSLEIWKRVNGRWMLHRQMSSGLLVPPQRFNQTSPSQPIFDKPPR